MLAEIKFCGLTRGEDVAVAVELGARYVGVIFAPSPRRRSPEEARALFAAVPRSVVTVGVFGHTPADEIVRTATSLGLGCVQLHADPDAAAVREVRRGFRGEVWAAVRCAGSTLPAQAAELFREADGVVLDARVPGGALGGTGVTLDWAALAASVARLPRRGRLVLAGGLGPANVAAAVAALSPDVVDVSSGVELAPGIKDHNKMRAFAEALGAPSTPRGVGV